MFKLAYPREKELQYPLARRQVGPLNCMSVEAMTIIFAIVEN
jgi:hypothetical protein